MGQEVKVDDRPACYCCGSLPIAQETDQPFTLSVRNRETVKLCHLCFLSLCSTVRSGMDLAIGPGVAGIWDMIVSIRQSFVRAGIVR